MIPLPWLMLGAVIMAGVAGLWGYQHGLETAQNRAKAAALAEQHKIIKDFNETAVIDMEAAAAVERERAVKREKMLSTRHSLELDIARREATRAQHKPSPSCPPVPQCGLDPQSLGVLHAAIDAANGAVAPPAGKPDTAMPAGAETPGRGGGDGKALDTRPAGPVR